MKPDKETALGCAAFLLVLGVIVGALWVQSTRERATQRRAQVRKEQTGRTLAEFAARHDGVVDWSASLRRRHDPFTIDIARALVRADGRPALILADLEDVRDNGGAPLAHFRGKWTSDDMIVGVVLELSLKCSAQQCLELTGDNVVRGARFAVFARVERASRPAFRVSTTEPDEDAPEGSIQIESDSDVIRLEGTCVDLLRLGEHDPIE